MVAWTLSFHRLGLTSNTEQSHCARVVFETLPNKVSESFPCEPSTIKSACHVDATSLIFSGGDPNSICSVTCVVLYASRSAIPTFLINHIAPLRSSTKSGEKKQEKEETEKGWYRMERQYGYFSRSIPLPYAIEYDKSDAEYKSGILSIKLPKSAVQQKATKTIPVKKV